jgi:Mn2+/Fe2+ NRAMP family transporter
MLGLKGSLDAKPRQARLFYSVIVAATFAGASLNGIGINPIKALYWTAVVNGVLAVPLMAIMMLIVRNPRAMGRLTLPPRLTFLGWLATGIMAVATMIFFASLF